MADSSRACWNSVESYLNAPFTKSVQNTYRNILILSSRLSQEAQFSLDSKAYRTWMEGFSRFSIFCFLMNRSGSFWALKLHPDKSLFAELNSPRFRRFISQTTPPNWTWRFIFGGNNGVKIGYHWRRPVQVRIVVGVGLKRGHNSYYALWCHLSGHCGVHLKLWNCLALCLLNRLGEY